MRLIDADLMKQNIIDNGAHEIAEELQKWVDNQNTIDAITVEWMNAMIERNLGYNQAFEWVLEAWQKEQGLDNSDKSGAWIPLGHRSGTLSHPWSEDFKCPFCGYEAYTILTLPPERCPRCHAKLMLEQEGE